MVPSPSRSSLVLLVAVIACGLSAGCKRNPRVVPVAGKILYNGQPLPFGSVTFQPDKGQPAVGDVASGTFTLSSYSPNDGAVPGKHGVAVVCYESQRPGFQAQGDSLGRLLIPLKYTRLGSSGLSADINDAAGDKPQEIVLELSGPPIK